MRKLMRLLNVPHGTAIYWRISCRVPNSAYKHTIQYRIYFSYLFLPLLLLFIFSQFGLAFFHTLILNSFAAAKLFMSEKYWFKLARSKAKKIEKKKKLCSNANIWSPFSEWIYFKRWVCNLNGKRKFHNKIDSIESFFSRSLSLLLARSAWQRINGLPGIFI